MLSGDGSKGSSKNPSLYERMAFCPLSFVHVRVNLRKIWLSHVCCLLSVSVAACLLLLSWPLSLSLSPSLSLSLPPSILSTLSLSVSVAACLSDLCRLVGYGGMVSLTDDTQCCVCLFTMGCGWLDRWSDGWSDKTRILCTTRNNWGSLRLAPII